MTTATRPRRYRDEYVELEPPAPCTECFQRQVASWLLGLPQVRCNVGCRPLASEGVRK